MARDAARRMRIVAAASRLFSQRGFSKTNMEEIAAEARIAKGSVYLEFPDKDVLFSVVLRAQFAKYADDWLTRFAADSAEWSFARMFLHSIEAVNAAPLVRALFTQDHRLYGDFLVRRPELLPYAERPRAKFIQELQKLGAIRSDIPAPVIAQLMDSVGFGLVARAGAGSGAGKEGIPFEETVGALGRLLDRGLAPVAPKNLPLARKLTEKFVRESIQALKHSLESP